MTRPRPVIAIDGPAGAGKSTVALRLAQRLGFVLVDTGALYRGVALTARQQGIDFGDGAALGALTRGLDLSFVQDADGPPRLHVGGVDCSAEIRTPEISMAASHVSRHPEVRQALLGLQRKLGRQGGVVLEGRDIGTVVFPDAETKIFLTASPVVRAERRVDDLRCRGIEADFQETLADVEARDRQDSSRPIAPLKPADDAVMVDSTGLSIDQVVDNLASLARTRGA